MSKEKMLKTKNLEFQEVKDLLKKASAILMDGETAECKITSKEIQIVHTESGLSWNVGFNSDSRFYRTSTANIEMTDVRGEKHLIVLLQPWKENQ